MDLLHQPGFADGSPAQVREPGLAKVRARDRLEAASRVEPSRELVGHALARSEPTLTSYPDRGLVETLGVEFAALRARDLRPDKREPVFEVLRTALRPCFQLSVVRA